MNNIDVVGIGALNIDHLYRVERILNDGESIVSDAKSFPGGSAANTIYGLARLKVNTAFMGAVGDDDEGQVLLKDFQSAGVDTSHIRVKTGAKTGSVLCLSDQRGKRSLYVSPGANSQLTADDIDLNFINQAGMLHLSSFADDKQFQPLLHLISRLDTSVKLSFSPGALYVAKGLKALMPILNRVHVLFLNHKELRQLTGEDVIAGTQTCLNHGCHIVVVTLGKGIRLELSRDTGHRAITATAYIKETGNEYVIKPQRQDRTSAIDATGAGDAFAAGFLYGLLREKGLLECGQLGDIVAHFVISQEGARQGFPGSIQLARRYQELYE